MKKISLFILCFIALSISVFAEEPSSQNQEDLIPVRDKTYVLIQKRKKESNELLIESERMILKAKAIKDSSLLAEGELKKQVAQKEIIRLEAEEKKHKDRDITYVR